jgi:hypothetical protein
VRSGCQASSSWVVHRLGQLGVEPVDRGLQRGAGFAALVVGRLVAAQHALVQAAVLLHFQRQRQQAFHHRCALLLGAVDLALVKQHLQRQAHQQRHRQQHRRRQQGQLAVHAQREHQQRARCHHQAGPAAGAGFMRRMGLRGCHVGGRSMVGAGGLAAPWSCMLHARRAWQSGKQAGQGPASVWPGRQGVKFALPASGVFMQVRTPCRRPSWAQ